MRFSENLFQNESIEKVQNYQLLSHENMPISHTEGYFKTFYNVKERRSSCVFFDSLELEKLKIYNL